MKLTVAKRTRSICRVLLILMIFSLFVTGCGQNIDTNPDNDGGDPNTNVVTVLENGFKPSGCRNFLYCCKKHRLRTHPKDKFPFHKSKAGRYLRYFGAYCMEKP